MLIFLGFEVSVAESLSGQMEQIHIQTNLLQENLEEQEGAAKLIAITNHEPSDIKNLITAVVRH